MFAPSVDSQYLSAPIMSYLLVTKAALHFYSRTLGDAGIGALCAPPSHHLSLSLSVAFVIHVWMSNDTFDICKILPGCIKNSGLILVGNA